MTHDVDALLRRAVETCVAPGLVAMVGDGDTIRYSGCAGLREIERGAAMTGDTVFWLASFTKLVTSIAALQLVERGLLSLDDPIAPVLPALADCQVLAGFDADGNPMLRAPARTITLRHLLSHTSGLGYDVMDEALLRARGDAGPPPANTLASLHGPLRFDPGDGWIYGTGIDWVGLAVEAVSGQSLDTYFARDIFAVLGMRDTGFDAPTARRAQLYHRGNDGAFAPIPSPVDDRNGWEYLSGGGGLFGTAPDFMRLLQALLGGDAAGERRLLSPAMSDLLFRPQTGSHRAGVLASVLPGLNAPFDLFPGMPTAWSLGGLVNPDRAPGGRAAGSLGWAGWANTYYWVDRQSDLCAVLLAQFVPFADPAMTDLLRRFERTVYTAFGPRMLEDIG